MPAPLTVAVTGAAGQVGYSAIFRIASGELFGPDQPIVLRLSEAPAAMGALEAAAMELEDCQYPLLHGLEVTDTPEVVVDGASWVILFGAARREAGMERSELLGLNGEIFQRHGRAIAEHAAADVRTLVVGNPCNTNCLIAQANAPEVPADRWFAMMRLDQNRAGSTLARRAGVGNAEVDNVTVWGNHSATQFPDALNARIGDKPAYTVIGDDDWLRGPFVEEVAQRGAAIIAARGASSAASAAKAALDSIRDLRAPSPEGTWQSLGVTSTGEYDIPEGIVFGLPVRSDGTSWSVVTDLEVDATARAALARTADELLAERAAVAHLLP
jgi:malate dehydrogenase